MPISHPSYSSLAATAVLSARTLTHDRGGRTVLNDVSLKVGPRSCLGVIGPNGVGKTTLLQLLSGKERPDAGSVTLEPPTAMVGYLAQEHDRRAGETVRQALSRRTGVADAESELNAAAHDLASNTRDAARRYERALYRYESLGVSSFDARLVTVLDELGIASVASWDVSTLSGGQEAKVALASIELSQFDVVLLDEPTNDLDFAGLARLERWVLQREGATVVVSHDRAFLERTVTSVLELDEHHHTAREYGGGWSGYQSERANALRQAREAFEEFQRRKTQLTSRADRQRQWAIDGVRKELKNPPDHDKAQRDFRINRTEKHAHKARQTERALENLEVVERPFEGWDLRFSIDEATRAGEIVVRLIDVVVERATFRLGPINLEVAWGERVSLTGHNGSGKSTLIQTVLGTLGITRGSRWMGPGVVAGVLGQDRRALQSDHDLARYVSDRCRLSQSETRSLLAKFGLGPRQVIGPARLLSPGERTRAELAIFQAQGVNFLVLDEPTNHLDLPAIEQLEKALENFGGTLLLTTHDRRLLDEVDISRTVAMNDGATTEVG
ncbi:MAG TPA: ABC-F family ATP-binding cassette domain-containing protein [Acidimicrobiales bacterium]|nr:ABC-F family ATP-binding cassette domain-containing protein [Acidimicrobiales bacterium]